MPVARRASGELCGVEAVIDKDLASALLYLCSTEASYVTGVNLKVSGGYLI